jgi:hypothetical protein
MRSATMFRARVFATLIVFGSGLPTLNLNSQGLAPQHLDDNSDWWSNFNADYPATKVAPPKRNISSKNLQILGVVLGDEMLSLAGTEFGSVRPVVRGDGAKFREQACYALPVKEYLIFEHGEVGATYYLFSDGRTWTGQDACVAVARAPNSVSTGSGLRLGQTPEQVIAILGQPSERTQDQFRYLAESKRSATAEELAQFRKEHPELNEQQLRKNSEFNVTVSIVAKFAQSQLSYLAVSKVETMK